MWMSWLPNGAIRRYSLCGQAGQPQCLIAGLHEPKGRGGSAYFHDKLQTGSTIRVRPPRDNFALEPAPECLFIAGGIGITPILPMIRTTAEAGLPWRLIYLGRKRNSLAFLDELAPYGNNVQIHAGDENGRYPLSTVINEPDADFHLYVCVGRDCFSKPSKP